MNRRDNLKQLVCCHGPSFCDVALGLRLLHFQSLRDALKANEIRAFFSHRTLTWTMKFHNLEDESEIGWLNGSESDGVGLGSNLIRV
jgi:hypothetical protein